MSEVNNWLIQNMHQVAQRYEDHEWKEGDKDFGDVLLDELYKAFPNRSDARNKWK